MGKIILFISLFSFTLGLSQNKKAKVYFEIAQKEVRDSTWLRVKLVNNSKDNIWIALDTVAENQNRNFLCTDSFYKGLEMREDLAGHLKEEPSYAGMLVSAQNFDCIDDRERNIKNKNNLILVKKGEKTVFAYFFTLKKMQRANPGYYREYTIEDIVKKEGYVTLSLIYSMSSQWIEHYIKKELLQELSDEHYVPFIDKIESNKIKFVY
ncbi:hypothetical protein [Myroides odoratus]|uniref:hypothetical protein n=1 Tax=Myroides odoratus TaxID=256 RepID=UPI0039AEDD9E